MSWARGAMLLAAALGLVLSATKASAQGAPDRPVRLLVGYAPGGSIDTLARIVAQDLAERWPAGVVVENRAGADSVIAAKAVAQAPPDGTLLFVASNAFATTATRRDLGYDPVKSFAPIILVASVPNLLVVNRTVPARSLAQLVALAKARPGSLNYGSPGASSPSYQAMRLLMQQAGIELVNVPYKGAAPALTDLLGGSIQVMFGSITSAIQHVESGQLVALAMSTRARSALLPQVPTVAEELGTSFDEVGTWVGLMAPAGTPGAIIERMRYDVSAVVRSREPAATLHKQGFVPLLLGPEAFARFVGEEIAKAAALQ